MLIQDFFCVSSKRILTPTRQRTSPLTPSVFADDQGGKKKTNMSHHLPTASFTPPQTPQTKVVGRMVKTTMTTTTLAGSDGDPLQLKPMQQLMQNARQ